MEEEGRKGSKGSNKIIKGIVANVVKKVLRTGVRQKGISNPRVLLT